MYICAFRFDINWFMTLPGLLISGGVILLLLSLLLFATSSRKGKSKVQKEEIVPTNVAPNFNDPMMNMDSNMNQPISNEQFAPAETTPVFTEPQVQNDSFSVNPVQVEPVISETSMPEGTPIATEQMIQEVSPVNMENVIPVNQDIQEPIMEQPTVEMNVNPVNVEAVNSEVIPTPIEETSVEPNIPPVGVEESRDIPTENQIVTETSSMPNVIPKVDEVKQEEIPQIYGGTDPLDKTQTIPVIHTSVEQPQEEQMKTETTDVTQSVIPEQPVYQEAKIVEDKDIEVLDF